MFEVNFPAGCDNAPKQRFLKDMSIAFAKGDLPFVLERLADDFRWELVGEQVIEGKASFAEALELMFENTASKLELYSIITHGKEGAINGICYMNNGKKYGFCDVYEFKGAKEQLVKAIRTYVLELKD